MFSVLSLRVTSCLPPPFRWLFFCSVDGSLRFSVCGVVGSLVEVRWAADVPAHAAAAEAAASGAATASAVAALVDYFFRLMTFVPPHAVPGADHHVHFVQRAPHGATGLRPGKQPDSRPTSHLGRLLVRASCFVPRFVLFSRWLPILGTFLASSVYLWTPHVPIVCGHSTTTAGLCLSFKSSRPFAVAGGY